MRCDGIKAQSTPQVEWEKNAIVYIYSFIPTSLSYCALLIKIPSIGIQGFEYDGKTLKKAFEYIT